MSESTNISSDSEIDRRIRGRSFCLETELSVEKVCELEARPNESGNRCLSPKLDNNKVICRFPIPFNREMSCQSEKGEIHNNSDSPNLASSVLVFDSVTDVNSRSNKAPNLPGTSTIPARESTPTDREQQSNSRGLENFMGGDSTTKLSKTGADLHQQAWRPGTQIAYKSAWGKWASWCSEQSFNPFQTIVANIVEFLTKLFQDSLQYIAMNTYRSAI